MLYVIRERIWATDDKFIEGMLEKGGPSIFANPAQFPATYAQMQLAMHEYYIRKGNLRAAEDATSAAILGLLVSNPDQPATGKILVGLLTALVTEQDIVGAFQLLDVIGPYISKRLSQQSVLYTRNMSTCLVLFSSLTNLNSMTEKYFSEMTLAI